IRAPPLTRYPREPVGRGLFLHRALRLGDRPLVPGEARGLPATDGESVEKVLELPYGENPHQRAAYYAQVGARTHVLSMVSQLGGKELSFNNLLDLDSARLQLAEFQ